MSKQIKEDLKFLKVRRDMECIIVLDGEEVQLLFDDYRSLMRNLYNVQSALLNHLNVIFRKILMYSVIIKIKGMLKFYSKGLGF